MLPSRSDTMSTLAPASFNAFTGMVSSTFSNPSAASTAIRFRFNTLFAMNSFLLATKHLIRSAIRSTLDAQTPTRAALVRTIGIHFFGGIQHGLGEYVNF